MGVQTQTYGGPPPEPAGPGGPGGPCGPTHDTDAIKIDTATLQKLKRSRRIILSPYKG